MYLDTELDIILVPLSEVLRVGRDDMPHSLFDYYTYSIKDKLPQEVTVEDDILKFTDFEKKISKMA